MKSVFNLVLMLGLGIITHCSPVISNIAVQTTKVEDELNKMKDICQFDDDSMARMEKTTDPNAFHDVMIAKTKETLISLKIINDKFASCSPAKDASIVYAKDMNPQCMLSEKIELADSNYPERKAPFKGAKYLNPGVIDVVKVLAPVIQKLPCEKIKVSDIQIMLSPKRAGEIQKRNQNLKAIDIQDPAGHTRKYLVIPINPGQFESGLTEANVEKALIE